MNALYTGAIGFAGASTAVGAAYDVAASNADQEYSSLGSSLALGAGVGATFAGIGIAGGKLTEDILKDNLAGARYLGEKVGTTALENGIKLGVDVAKLGKEVVRDTAGLAAGLGENIAKNFLTINPKNENVFGGLSLNKKGKIAATLIGLGTFINEANEGYNESRMGRPMGVVNSTPIIDGPSTDNYSQRLSETYGAGGDLVFAMNKLRNRGFR